MKATELRIGNLVTVNNPKYHPQIKGEVLKVVGINEAENLDRDGRTHSVSLNFVEKSKNIVIPAVSQFIGFVEPIPLTAKLVTRLVNEFVIIKNQEEGIVIVDRFKLIWKHAYNYWYVLNSTTSSYITKVEFVHEWQNVFFDLNGLELKIK